MACSCPLMLLIIVGYAAAAAPATTSGCELLRGCGRGATDTVASEVARLWGAAESVPLVVLVLSIFLVTTSTLRRALEFSAAKVPIGAPHFRRGASGPSLLRDVLGQATATPGIDESILGETTPTTVAVGRPSKAARRRARKGAKKSVVTVQFSVVAPPSGHRAPSAAFVEEVVLPSEDADVAAGVVEAAHQSEEAEVSVKVAEAAHPSDRGAIVGEIANVGEASGGAPQKAAHPSDKGAIVGEIANIGDASGGAPQKADHPTDKVPSAAEATKALGCSCRGYNSWGCAIHREYGRTLLLAHQTVSWRVARGPPGLAVPAGQPASGDPPAPMPRMALPEMA